MPLNKARGNMYNWTTHTFNVIKGECPHACSYCYCKRWGKQAPLHFDEKELKTNLGSGNTIFVGSSCDMWADVIPTEQINAILGYCSKFSNIYIFQSKNPQRITRLFIYQPSWFPVNTTVGTTIESNRTYDGVTGGQIPWRRMMSMRSLSCPRFVSIEPILDFDLDVMLGWMQEIKPEFVSIGADSGNNHLPEPSPGKVKALITELQSITQVKIKENLYRLLPKKLDKLP